MMDWTTLLVNAPIVGAFIWFANIQTKAYLTTLSAQEERYATRNAALVTAIQENTKVLSELLVQMCEHDARTIEMLRPGKVTKRAVA